MVAVNLTAPLLLTHKVVPGCLPAVVATSSLSRRWPASPALLTRSHMRRPRQLAASGRSSHQRMLFHALVALALDACSGGEHYVAAPLSDRSVEQVAEPGGCTSASTSVCVSVALPSLRLPEEAARPRCFEHSRDSAVAHPHRFTSRTPATRARPNRATPRKDSHRNGTRNPDTRSGFCVARVLSDLGRTGLVQVERGRTPLA